MGTKLQCLACGQLYQFNRDNPPWPRCGACQGELAPPIEELEVLQDLTATDDSSLLTVSDHDPLAAKHPHAAGGALAGKPSPFLNPARGTSSGLPFMAWVGIGGGAVALLLMAVVMVVALALWGRGGSEVAQAPKPPVDLSQFPPPAPVPTRGTPTTPVVPHGNPSSTPARPAEPSPPPKPATPDSELPRTARNDGKKSGTIRTGAGRSQEGFTGSQDYQPRTPWSVTPDPAEPYERPETERPIDIDFKSRVDQLVFPSRPSPYFAAATKDFRNPEIRIFDWRTGRSGRKFPGKLHYTENLSALSADGEHMTTVLSKGGETGIVIVETKTGKAIHTIGIEGQSSIKALAFAGPNRFLAIVYSYSEKVKNRVGVWNLEDGSSLTDFGLETPVQERFSSASVEANSLAISPGGNQFAVLLDKFVCVYETETGKLLGETKLPTDSSMYNGSLTYSPDGTELVAIAGHSIDESLIYRIDVATGETVGSAKINASDFKDVRYYQNLGRLQFLPALKAYLIDGTYIVEQTTGETLYRLDAFKGMARVFDAKRVAGITARANSSGFAEARLPVAEIEKLAAVFQGGGKLLDGLLGEAKAAATDTAQALQVPGQMMDWTLPAWDPPEKSKGKKELSLAAPTDHTWQFDAPLFSQPGNHIAWLPRNDRINSRLFAVNVVTGRAEGDIDMLPGSRVIDISPDGSLVITGFSKRDIFSSQSYERLEVFSIPLKKHVFAWRMGGAVEGSGPGSKRNNNSHLFKEAYFIEKTLVLTRMENGRLVLWKLPDATALWKLDGDIRVVDFSPDRSFVQLYLPALEKYSWLEVRTGEWKGDMRAASGWSGTTLAISPDRKRTASLTNANGYSKLSLRAVGDTGSEGLHLDIPAVGGPLTWLNDNYLVAMGSGVVLDANNGAPLWRIAAPNIKRSPDGTYWISKRAKGEVVLTRTSFPSDKLFTKLKAARGQPLKPIVGPGARVAVQGGFDTDPASLARIQAEFDRRGWIFDPNGSFRINGSVSQQPGTNVEYQNMLTRERSSVTIPGGVLIQINLTDITGKVLWKTEYKAGGGGYAPSMVTLREGESLQDKVVGNQGSGPKPEISSVPAVIFQENPFGHLPGMTLSEQGEKY